MPIRCAGSTGAFDAVDIFDATSGTWSTAALSVARCWLAATSLPNAGLSIFAGGYASALYEYTSGLMLLIVSSAGMRGGDVCMSRVVLEPLLLNTDTWRAGSTGAFDAVDIFDATKGTWSTAALSVARYFLAATSLPNAGLAMFAGGYASALYEYTSGLMLLISCGWNLGNTSVVWMCFSGTVHIIDAFRMFVGHCCQYCRHLQCDQWNLEHSCSQRC
jgi:hypothetical protein